MTGEMEQVSEFFISMSIEERKDLCEAIAENIYFLDEKLQEKILELLYEAEPKLCAEIRKINGFTS